MKFTLDIELGNDAMQTYNDIREAFEKAMHPACRKWNAVKPAFPSIGDGGPLKDVNGNSVGHWEVID